MKNIENENKFKRTKVTRIYSSYFWLSDKL